MGLRASWRRRKARRATMTRGFSPTHRGSFWDDLIDAITDWF